jgi:DNA sulfur modification protein DndC
LETDALWLYLTLSQPPWGSDNEKLAQLYKQANGECPLVIDKSTPTCGGSRFGCWTCTVVKSDKSMQGFVERGDDWMKPLLEFRDWLKVMRNEARHRKKTRRDGKPGLGPYTLKARREIYQRLIQAEELVREIVGAIIRSRSVLFGGSFGPSMRAHEQASIAAVLRKSIENFIRQKAGVKLPDFD